MPTTPNMDLELPTVSETLGPEWATELNEAFETVDSHDHSTGKGVPITPSGLNIDADLPFNGNDATELRSTRYESQASSLAGGADLGCLYNLNGAPAWNDNSGTASRVLNVGVPLATGDVFYASNSTSVAKLAAGTNGQVLKLAGGLPSWAAASSTLVTQSKTMSFVLSSGDDLYLCDDSGGAITATLPASTGSGKVYTLKKEVTSSNAITIARSVSDVILDAGSTVTSTTINTIGESIVIVDAVSGTWQVLERRIPSIWVDYTPTFTNFGTPTNVSVKSRRSGDSLEVKGFFTVGSGAGAEGRMSLGFNGTSANVTSAGSSKIASIEVCGSGYIGATSGLSVSLLAEQSKTYICFGIQNTSFAGTAKRNGNDFDSVVNMSFYFKIPINGWNG